MMIRSTRRMMAGRRDGEVFEFVSLADDQGAQTAWLDRVRRTPFTRTAAIRASDAAAFLIAVAASWAICAATGEQPAAFSSLTLLNVAVFVGLLAFWTMNPRSAGRAGSFHHEAGAVAASAAAALAAGGFLAFWTGAEPPRFGLLATWAAFPAAVLACRACARAAMDRAGVGMTRVLVAGRGEAARGAADALRAERALGWDVVHHVDVGLLSDYDDAGRLGRLLGQVGAERLVVAADASGWPQPDLLRRLAQDRVAFALWSEPRGLPIAGCEHIGFHARDAALLNFRTGLGNPAARGLKVAMDLMLAVAALIVLAPLFLLIAAVVAFDGGPVFYAHRRIGAGGRPFACLKFRSMVVDGDHVLRQHLEANPEAAAEWAATQKLRFDPRVTWIGSLLRRTSLDELPQLLNVLRLEMSLVGPRPIVASEVAKYAGDIAFYYAARPGLTGLWQISGRSKTSYSRRVELDSWYVRNWTFWHDVAIILKTVPAVLARKGAI